MLAQHSVPFSPGRRRTHAEAALDLEGLALAAGSDYEDAWRSSRWRPLHAATSGYTPAATCSSSGSGSGLPLVCSNCGVSFFSLLVADDELECYCSGECKWSVVMSREMDRRVRALSRHLHAVAAAQPAKTAAIRVTTGESLSGSVSSAATSTDSDSYGSCSPLLLDLMSCH